MSKIVLDESKDKEIINKWFEEAKEMSLDKLTEFISKLINEYQHDYGTIVHAIVASAIAAAWSVENSKQGGITGFQASFIDLEFIKRWGVRQSPFAIQDYNNILYPQYENYFKTISKDTWEVIQEKAKKNLEDGEYASLNVINHWKSIVDGKIPFGLQVEDD